MNMFVIFNTFIFMGFFINCLFNILCSLKTFVFIYQFFKLQLLFAQMSNLLKTLSNRTRRV